MIVTFKRKHLTKKYVLLQMKCTDYPTMEEKDRVFPNFYAGITTEAYLSLYEQWKIVPYLRLQTFSYKGGIVKWQITSGQSAYNLPETIIFSMNSAYCFSDGIIEIDRTIGDKQMFFGYNYGMESGNLYIEDMQGIAQRFLERNTIMSEGQVCFR
jgi:hypothetical protein